jgi:Ca2+-binding EF-hand superfamily protein
MKGAGERQQKMVKRFIEKDTYRFDFSASELDRLVRLFRAASDNKKNETMRRETFMKIMNLSDNASKEKGHKEIALLHLLFDTFDVKGKGSITLQEFLIGVSFWKAELSNADDKMIFFFNLFDKDQDGKLSQTEFSDMMHHIVSMEVYGKNQAQLPTIAHDTCTPIAPMEVSTPTGSRQGEIARKAVHIMFKDDSEACTTGRLSQKGFKTWVLSNPGAVERLEATEGALLAAWALFSSTRGDKKTELMDRAQVVQIIQCTHIMEKSLPHSIEILVEEYVEQVFAVCELDVDGTVNLPTFRGWLVTNSHLGEQLVATTRAERKGWGDEWESSGNLQKAVNDGSFKIGVLHVMTETERRATISNAINSTSVSPGNTTPHAMEKLSSMESFFKKKGTHTLSRGGASRGTVKQDSIRLKKGTLKRGTLKQVRGAGEQLKKAKDSMRSSISRASLRRKGSASVKYTENPVANSTEAPGIALRDSDSLSLDVIVI